MRRAAARSAARLILTAAVMPLAGSAGVGLVLVGWTSHVMLLAVSALVCAAALMTASGATHAVTMSDHFDELQELENQMSTAGITDDISDVIGRAVAAGVLAPAARSFGQNTPVGFFIWQHAEANALTTQEAVAEVLAPSIRAGAR